MKKQFQDQIKNEEDTFKIQQQLKKLQNLENQQYIKMQMEQRDKVKKIEVEEAKTINTKSHFGPEENEEVALYLMKKN